MSDGTKSEEPGGSQAVREAGPAGSTLEKRDATPRRKKRGWLRLVGVLIVILALFVLAAPWIISQPVVTNRVLSFANDALAGEIGVQRLSLTWLGPTTIERLVVVDPQQRPVIRVSRLQLASGVWKLLTAREAFGEMVIDSPKIVLHLDENNDPSIADAFQPANPAPDDDTRASEGTLPAPEGKITITNGSVEVTRGEEGSYQATELNGEFDVATLNNLEGKLELKLDGDSQVAGELSVSDLAARGSINVRGASGTIKLAMDRPAQIGPLAAILLHQKELRGEATLKLDARIEPGDLSAHFDAKIAGFQTEQRAATKASPLDAAVTGAMTLKDNELTARADLSGTPGTAHTDLTYRLAASAPEVSLEQVMATVLGGQPLALPEFELTAESHIDLTAFERAIPGMLPLKGKQSLTSGRLEIPSLKISGGEAPAVSVAARLADVQARDAKQTITLTPVSLDIDAKSKPDRGVVIERMELTSGFAEIQAVGSLSEMRAQFQSDLTALKKELGQIVDFGEIDLGGRVTGALALVRADEQHIDTTLELNVNEMRYRAGDQAIEMPKATVSQTGRVLLKDRALARIESREVRADLNGELVAAGNGWYDADTQAIAAKLNLQRADLGSLSRRAAGLGVQGLDRFTGNISGEITVERASDSESLGSSGRLIAQQLTADGRPLLKEDATLSWSGAKLEPARRRLALPTAEFDSEVAEARVSRLDVDMTGKGAAHGELNGTIDLARLLSSLAIVTQQERPPEIRGRLTFNAAVSRGTEGVKVAGAGDITPFEIGAGDQIVRDEKVQFEYDATVDLPAKRLVLGTNRISSRPLAAEVTGAIEDLDTDLVASLQGSYEASWKELTALLHELMPETAELIVIEGTTKSDFQVKGPLRKAGAQPAFRGASAQTRVAWDAAQLAGVGLGKAVWTPRLSDGQLILPKTTIPAAAGKVQLAGVLDFRPTEPTLRMPGSNQVLDGVKVTPELCREILSHINPIFYDIAAADGIAYLTVNDLVFPFGEAAQATAMGNGRLELVTMRIEPAGLLMDLLALSGKTTQEMVTVGVRGVDFVVKDGRVSYHDFTLLFPAEFDLRFFGSVGLDDTLDLAVTVPVRAGLLERLGVRGSAAQYAEMLTGSRVDIPIVGTRQRPVIDLQKVDVKALVEHALKKSAGESLESALRGLLQDKKKRDDKSKRRKD